MMHGCVMPKGNVTSAKTMAFNMTKHTTISNINDICQLTLLAHINKTSSLMHHFFQ